MIGFLLKRPVAVLMSYLALTILGVLAFISLPVSLLPDIDIPHMTVRATSRMGADEMEARVTAPLLRQLMQTGSLDHISGETRDGAAEISLSFAHGTDTELAFIEVNEKIDEAMATLPREVARPTVVRADAADIPVVYLHITETAPSAGHFETNLPDVAENSIRRRLEQLPEVSMVDVAGLPEKSIAITCDENVLRATSVTTADIRDAIAAAFPSAAPVALEAAGSRYSLRLDRRLTDVEELREIRFLKNGKLYRAGDLCDIRITESQSAGLSVAHGKAAVTMALIKHPAYSVARMNAAVDSTIAYFAAEYPEINISKSRDQSYLLDLATGNLEQNLVLGIALLLALCMLFMRKVSVPLVVGSTVVVAVIITFAVFYLFGFSLNIISLAGLILAVGMMIDNSVIVAENIMQYRSTGLPPDESCIRGTNEVITPLLSSSLTTIAVFLPLIFLSGIAGDVFTDQAFAITAGLGVSYAVSITLLPVLMYLSGALRRIPGQHLSGLDRWYDRGFRFVFRHKGIAIAISAVCILAAVPLYHMLDTARMPDIDSDEALVKIDWGHNTSIAAARQRTEALTSGLGSIAEQSAFIGPQTFMLDECGNKSASDAELYLKTKPGINIQNVIDSVRQTFVSTSPGVVYTVAPPANVFEKVFADDRAPLEIYLAATGADDAEMSRGIADALRREGIGVTLPPMERRITLIPDYGLMALYSIPASNLTEAVASALASSPLPQIATSQSAAAPVVIGGPGMSVERLMATTFVKTAPDSEGNVHEIPLKSIAHTYVTEDFKTINTSTAGRYIPLRVNCSADSVPHIIARARLAAAAWPEASVTFGGSYFSTKRLMEELARILLISLLLMYFILCAQFESLLQPLIVLLEIPIDISFALLCLLIFGQTLNLMSAIGIIITCGIVVNDSILKIDAVNTLRRSGHPILGAIHEAGRRRLRAILLTSLTTIVAMVPVLFTSDLGSELQRPLAIAVIGSMVAGTVVSIFIIPLFYWIIYHVKKTA